MRLEENMGCPTTSITPTFWKNLERIRNCSRLVLAALAENDVERVEQVTRESETLMAEIAPVLEERRQDPNRNEDDEMLFEIVHELKQMNTRIIDELKVRADETRVEIGRIRESRLKLVHHRPQLSIHPSILDRSS